METHERLGDVIGERYQLREKIGEGGQSYVYRARDINSKAEVAIKVMREKVARDPHARERMSREATALMNLEHTPAALRIFGQFWTEDGRLCLVTELLRGLDLDDFLKRNNERLPLRAVVSLFPPVIETLRAAHEQGVIHRDLKPGNIFVVSKPPSIRLLDFGFAKFTKLRSFTAAGMVAGSPRYISPESWRGQQDLDQRADVYSMGALIFRCLAGRPPFQCASLPELLEAVTEDPRPSLHALAPHLPRAIDSWTKVVLESDREKRFQNIEAMWNAFTSIIAPRN